MQIYFNRQFILDSKTPQQQIIGLVFWLILCFSASAIGAIASIQAQSFYGSLVQPIWAPPAWLFGPVWTVLYAMMAISTWLIWRRGGFKTNPKALWFFYSSIGFKCYLKLVLLCLAARPVVFCKYNNFVGFYLINHREFLAGQ